ncbi:uncharacterized protein LOC129273206 isoform X2 [Lytechinus pictus]|uniref:uncharacterized protein LOC129273206 isoform X2 n=1 Tax=Lytechinus pictus TaxID=7653 RepID=UPI0030B9F1F2
MWNRNSYLSSVKDNICIRRENLKNVMPGNEVKMKESLAVRAPTKPEAKPKQENALSQLRVMYPDSSGESSSEMSDNEVEEWDKTGESGKVKNSKNGEDQSKLQNMKNSEKSVGMLLSQLRRENKSKQHEFKIPHDKGHSRAHKDVLSNMQQDSSNHWLHQSDNHAGIKQELGVIKIQDHAGIKQELGITRTQDHTDIKQELGITRMQDYAGIKQELGFTRTQHHTGIKQELGITRTQDHAGIKQKLGITRTQVYAGIKQELGITKTQDHAGIKQELGITKTQDHAGIKQKLGITRTQDHTDIKQELGITKTQDHAGIKQELGITRTQDHAGIKQELGITKMQDHAGIKQELGITRTQDHTDIKQELGITKMQDHAGIKQELGITRTQDHAGMKQLGNTRTQDHAGIKQELGITRTQDHTDIKQELGITRMQNHAVIKQELEITRMQDHAGIKQELGINPALAARNEKTGPGILVDRSWQAVGQLISIQVPNEKKEMPDRVNTKCNPTHQGTSSASQAEINNEKGKDEVYDPSPTCGYSVSEDNEVESIERDHEFVIGPKQSQVKASSQVKFKEDRNNNNDDLLETVGEMAYVAQEEQGVPECNENQTVIEVPHSETISESDRVNHPAVEGNKTTKEGTFTMITEPANWSLSISSEVTGNAPVEECQYLCAKQPAGLLAKCFEITKEVQDVNEVSKESVLGTDTINMVNNHLQEVKEGFIENPAVCDDASKSSGDLMGHEVLPDKKQRDQEKEILIQCESDGFDHSQENSSTDHYGEHSVSSEISSKVTSSFSEPIEDKMESPSNDQKVDFKRQEEKNQVGADLTSTDINNEALLDSDSVCLDFTEECLGESGSRRSSPEIPQRMYSPDCIDDPCLQTNLVPEQTGKSLEEANDDFHLKRPENSCLKICQRGDKLRMQDIDLDESKGRVPFSYLHLEAEKQSSPEKTNESDGTFWIDQRREIISGESTGLVVTFSNENVLVDSNVSPQFGHDMILDLTKESSDLSGYSNNQSKSHSVTSLMNDFEQSTSDSFDDLREHSALQLKEKEDEGCNTGKADTDQGDVNLLSVTSGALDSPVINTVLEDSDESMGCSLSGLSDALDLEFGSASPSPVKMKNHNTSQSLVGIFNSLFDGKAKESTDAAMVDTNDGIELDVKQEVYSETDSTPEHDLGDLGTELQEKPQGNSCLGDETPENEDALSLVCDTEDLMSNLEDLLQDENLQLTKQSPEKDKAVSVDDSSTSTSTKDMSVESYKKQCSSSSREMPSSPLRSRTMSRTTTSRSEDRSQRDTKPEYKVSIHSRNENSRYVFKSQEAHRNLALQQLIRNGPVIQPSEILQQQLQQKQQLQQQQLQQQQQKQQLQQQQQQLQQQQQELQRRLQQQLPPALQLRLGLMQNNSGLQPTQNVSDDVAMICQRQKVMVERLIQLYKQQRESDVLMEKQKDIIRHYQRAFLIAKKGGPLSMQQVAEDNTSRQRSTPRSKSPPPRTGSDPDRKIGKKWPTCDRREEYRYQDQSEAKRVKVYHGNREMREHSYERSSPSPDKEQPQRRVEQRIIKPREIPVRSRLGFVNDHDEGRQPRNLRRPSDEQMLISVPNKRPDDEMNQDRRCIKQKSSPLYSGTRDRPDPRCDDVVFQPIQDSHVEQRVGHPRAMSVRNEEPRGMSPVTIVEEYGDYYMNSRNPHMPHKEFPHESVPGPPCQEERTSSFNPCQGRRTPSPHINSQWESCRITERDTRTGVVIDYFHSSVNQEHSQVDRADRPEMLEPPPFLDRRYACPSPLDQHPSECFPEDVSQGSYRGPEYHGRSHCHGSCRAPLRPVFERACRTPPHPAAADIHGNYRPPMHTIHMNNGPVFRVPCPTSVIPSQGCFRSPRHPAMASHQGDFRSLVRPPVVAAYPNVMPQNFGGALPQSSPTPGPGLLESHMQSRVGYRQECGYPDESGQYADFGY